MHSTPHIPGWDLIFVYPIIYLFIFPFYSFDVCNVICAACTGRHCCRDRTEHKEGVCVALRLKQSLMHICMLNIENRK